MRYQLGILHVVVRGTRTGKFVFRVDFDERQEVRVVGMIRRRSRRRPIADMRRDRG